MTTLDKQFSRRRTEGRPRFCPKVEMSSQDNHLEVLAEIPGVGEKDLDLSLSRDGLTLSIKGKKRFKKQRKAEVSSERAYGEFARSVRLPFPVDKKKIEAVVHDGVLEIQLARASASVVSVKRIAINAT